MRDAGLAGGVGGAEFEQHVDKRAGLVVVAVKPFVIEVEDRQQLFLGGVGAPPSLGLYPAPHPALLTEIQERDYEVILGREVVVERGLGDVGVFDHLVDPDVAHATAGEQLVSGLKDPRADL